MKDSIGDILGFVVIALLGMACLVGGYQLLVNPQTRNYTSSSHAMGGVLILLGFYILGAVFEYFCKRRRNRER